MPRDCALINLFARTTGGGGSWVTQKGFVQWSEEPGLAASFSQTPTTSIYIYIYTALYYV